MLLEAREVTKAFGDFRAVDAASVTLEQGDILGLIGPNGAGKSTFFNCLTGDLLSTSGHVFFEGRDITNLTPEARARLGLARTFQVPQSFEAMSVMENVMIGAFLRTSRRSEAEMKARAVLERVGMAGLADASARSLGTPGRSGWKSRVRLQPNQKFSCSMKRWPASRSAKYNSPSISSAISIAPALRL